MPMTTQLTVDDCRVLHIGNLIRDHSSDPVAAEQIRLREEGTRLVLGTLKALGYKYTASNGWWISAFAAPKRSLGFVNTSKGIAVLTDVQLPPDVIEALTIPEQGAGQVASGAAAWTYPDAGEPRHSSAPDGWTQLLVDVRASVEGVAVTDVACCAHVIMWGLPTCYDGERGPAGYECLDPLAEKPSIAAEDWPCPTTIRQRLAERAEIWLKETAENLARIADVDISTMTVSEAVQFAGPREPFRAETPTQIARRDVVDAINATVNREIVEALRAHRFNLVARWESAQTVGCRYWDLLKYLCERILVNRLSPAAEVLREHLTPLIPQRPNYDETGYKIRPLLKDMAPHVLSLVLTPINVEPVDRELMGIYYSDGPVAVRIPHRNKTEKDHNGS